MGDHNISIVPDKLVYPGKEQKAAEILEWLVKEKIVQPVLSDCILSMNKMGYAIDEGAKQVLLYPDSGTPFQLLTNGLEIILERTVFHTGENGLDEVVCPSCAVNIGNLETGDEISGWLNEWYLNGTAEMACPSCNKKHVLNGYIYQPQWAFSDLGFSFWNWEMVTDPFLETFSEKLGCPVRVVHVSI